MLGHPTHRSGSRGSPPPVGCVPKLPVPVSFLFLLLNLSQQILAHGENAGQAVHLLLLIIMHSLIHPVVVVLGWPSSIHLSIGNCAIPTSSSEIMCLIGRDMGRIARSSFGSSCLDAEKKSHWYFLISSSSSCGILSAEKASHEPSPNRISTTWLSPLAHGRNLPHIRCSASN